MALYDIQNNSFVALNNEKILLALNSAINLEYPSFYKFSYTFKEGACAVE